MPDPVNTTRISKVMWMRPSATPDPYPGATYHSNDIAIVQSQSPVNPPKVGYYWGKVRNTVTHELEDHVLLVALDSNDVVYTNNPNHYVAKPCPPLCGNDGGILDPTNEINIEDIPT